MKFQLVLEKLQKVFPITCDENDPLLRRLADIISRAGGTTIDEDIEDLTQLLSDEIDKAFIRGQESHAL